MSIGSVTQANTELDADYGSGNPATLYAAIAVTLPNPAANGTVVEPSAGQWDTYAEQAVPNDGAHWPPAINGIKTNGVAITFPTPGVGSLNNQPITHLVIRSALGGGRVVDILALPAASVVTIGTAITFPPGSLTITAASGG